MPFLDIGVMKHNKYKVMPSQFRGKKDRRTYHLEMGIKYQGWHYKEWYLS